MAGAAALILASQSPRRKALLHALGLQFAVVGANVDETPLVGESPDALACRLCRAKAASVASRHPGATVLAADTMVAQKGVLLGKPADRLEATEMLVRLRGATHQVFTAVCLAQDGRLDARLSVSHVTMRRYSDEEIATYVASGDPLDKAGAYAIQDPHFAPAASWTGCYTGIMGLPLGLLRDVLAEQGIAVPADIPALCRSLSGGRCCLEI